MSWMVVEAPGIESPATSAPSVVERRVDDVDQATKGDAKRREVSASLAPDVDEAIRAAAKVAIDARDLDRARDLLDLLDAQRRTLSSPVLILATKRLVG